MQFFKVHPDNPQSRLISQAAAIVRNGGVIVYPTDSCYALGCQIGDKTAMERIRHIRHLDDGHNFTLVCRDMSEIAGYAKIENAAFRMIKALTPGPFTFVLLATREVPRRLQHPKRKTIGFRIPDNTIAQALLETLGEPLMSATLVMPGEDMPLTDPEEMKSLLSNSVDLILDGGSCGYEPTTVIDFVDGVPVVTRRGKGDTTFLDMKNNYA
jgi:tRNA threonylcarbamoyl adenosine modification protein (Sua5/YciO/YrdC/YwlC family)